MYCVFFFLLSQSAVGKVLIDQTQPWESWLCEVAASLQPSFASTSPSLLKAFSLVLLFASFIAAHVITYSLSS